MAAATAVDTATGQIEAPPGQTYVTVTKQPPGDVKVFKTNFETYINNENGVPAVRTVTNLVPGNYAGLENHENLYVVPYHNRGIAIWPAQFYRLVQTNDAIQVLEMGFEIKKVTILQENLTTRASTAILENTFQSRPSIYMYVDDEHIFDNAVGEPELTSYLTDNAFNPAMGDPISPYPSFSAVYPTRVTSNANMFDDAATAPCWASTQQAGSLINCSMYYQNQGDDTPWTMHDALPAHEFGEPVGPGKRFVWKNPKPEWERIQGYSYRINKETEFSRITDTSNGNPLWGSRDRALSMVYRGTTLPETTDDAVQVTADREIPERSSDQYGSQGPMSTSYSPPYVYLKVEPLNGPNSPMTIVVRLMMEYFIKVRVKQDTTTPMWIQPTPANTGNNNTIIIQHNLTFANPRKHVGLGSQTEWDASQIVRKRANIRGQNRPPSPTRRHMRGGGSSRGGSSQSASKRKHEEMGDSDGPPSLDYMGDSNELPNDIGMGPPDVSTRRFKANEGI